MATFLMTDDGIRFDGRTLEEKPLGGAETAFVSLAEALARRGHRVLVRNNCEGPLDWRGVEWAPLDTPAPVEADVHADVYIANRSYRLIGRFPAVHRRFFWIHNPARYLLKPRYLWRLAWWRPVILFSGAYHAASYPAWAPSGGRAVVPYGIERRFREAAPAAAVPGRRAIFTSNPLRSLDWVLDVWATRIHPRVPDAEFHVFSGGGTYGAVGARKAAPMRRVLDHAAALADRGVRLKAPVGKETLVEELRQSRVLLYRGDPGETFCLAVGEAQAMGVPCVLQDIGCVAERIVPGETGFVARHEEEFADAAVRLLTDDALWQKQHRAALARQRTWGWDDAARVYEELALR